MNTRPLKIGEKLESNTYYKAEEKHYDIFLSDTVRSEDMRFCSAVTKNHFGFLNIAFLLQDLENVTLDFNGAIVTCHGRIAPFVLDRCKNITVKNLIIEYERSFYTEFDVVSKIGDEFTVRRKEKFPVKVENGHIIPYADSWECDLIADWPQFMQTFDTETGKAHGITVVQVGDDIKAYTPFSCPIQLLKVREKENGDIVFIGDVPYEAHEGETVVLTHEPRDKCNILINECEGVTLENYRIINGAAFGVVGVYSKDVTMDRLVFSKDELSHGVITNMADALHTFACFGKWVIKNSIFEGMIDDAINVHGHFFLAREINGNTVKTSHGEELSGTNVFIKSFGAGDTVAVYNGKTMEEKTRFTVVDAEADSTGRVLTLIFDRDASEIQPGDTLENLSAQMELTIKDSVFDKANTHLRLQTRGKTLIDNITCSLEIMMTGDLNFWFESSPMNDITIQNSRFFGDRGNILILNECNPTPKAPYYHSGIKIINNTFEASETIIADHADDILIEGNKFVGENGEFTVKLNGCGRVVVRD